MGTIVGNKTSGGGGQLGKKGGGLRFRPLNRVELSAMGWFRLFFRAELLDATILPPFTRPPPLPPNNII